MEPVSTVFASRRARRVSCILLALAPAAVSGARAQVPDALPGDTTRIFVLEEMVVTAERAATPLATATAAVSSMDREALDRLPVRTVAEALQRMPGFSILSFDGLGFDPKLTVRGFYGGGEAEYVLVLVDGRPVNGLEAGLVDWDLVPLAAVERIEVLRGGASALYGDAAMGAVINIVTRRGEGAPDLRASLSGGGSGVLRGAAAADASLAGRPTSVFAEARRSDGFREHADRTAASAGGSLELLGRPGASLRVSTLHHGQEFEEPGPLSGAALAESRTGVAPFFRFDRTAERRSSLALDGRLEPRPGVRGRGYLVAELGREQTTRTLPLSAEFADTKDRESETRRLLGSAQLELAGPLAADDRVVAGVDVAAGGYDLDYFDVVTGPASAYAEASGARGDRVASGSGGREQVGAFVSYELRPLDALRLSLGGRVDWLRDRFDTVAGGGLEAEHTAFSPKLGANLRYLATPTQRGHVYAHWGRSFKAATLEQLFDPRPIPVPFPPYAITISNALLEPQHGTGVELGLYHGARLGSVEAELSLALYRIDMEDEIDFDLGTFRYVNIGRSRHDGVEGGVELTGPGGVSAFLNYTLQDVTTGPARTQLKAIPRHTVGGGVAWRGPSGLVASVTSTTLAGMWLDDANTLELPGFTRFDARLAHPVPGGVLALEAFNVLDAEFSTSGFPDPAGSDAVFYYPAAGRVLQLQLELGR